MSKKSSVIPKRNLEWFGIILSGICVLIIIALVFALIFMVANQGLATFFVDGVNFIDFITGTVWNPTVKNEATGLPITGAVPMIAGSFAVTFLSTLIATPLAIGAAVFVVEISPRIGKKYFQPAIELLVGIPSVVYGLIGLMVIVKFMRGAVGGTGYGILSGSIVLALMILPTITSLSIDALAAVPNSYRQGALALGSTRWQMISKVVLRAALPALMTSVILGMTRAFGEALAVQMVIGNAPVMPNSFFTPASTLTSVLTMGMGNSIFGTLENNVLWSLALLLMFMSLIFIAIIHLIGKVGSLEHTR
ncbi:MAG: phosphate ABC transporter permease subunit PstC [Coriobacteriia bacterium]|nr:phosphate ABC transporter permease subunit PstC [Coriobacteriia bacterium]